MLLCETLIPLVQSASWHAQLDLVDVNGPILIADDHIVVGFDSDTLVASYEHSQTPDYLLLFLIGDLFNIGGTMVKICLGRVIIDVIGGNTEKIISALFLLIVIVHPRVEHLLPLTEWSGPIVIIIVCTASMRNQIRGSVGFTRA